MEFADRVIKSHAAASLLRLRPRLHSRRKSRATGDLLRPRSDEKVAVTSVTPGGHADRVYNFQVRDLHTYFVGGFRGKPPCWCIMTSCCSTGPRPHPAGPKGTDGRIYSETQNDRVTIVTPLVSLWGIILQEIRHMDPEDPSSRAIFEGSVPYAGMGIT